MTTPLRQQWDRLNDERTKRSLQVFSYSHLAELASANDIPGEPVTVSKSTIAALMAGTYTAATSKAITKRLEQVIQIKLADLGIARPARKPRTKRPAQITIKRCSPEGYIKVGRQYYYLGQFFRGQLCTVHQHRDKDRTITVTARVVPSLTARAMAVPVDPTNNQLGYEVK